MISPKFFINSLSDRQIDFFSGVPDSLLKNICAYIADNKDEKHNIIAANEGAAIGLAAGHYLATGEIPVVYMQNSGEGNIINPLASLTDKEVYNIPILLLIGWRGEPGVYDEPQHVKQGKITIPLLDVMGIKNIVMSKNEVDFIRQLDDALVYMRETNEAFALIIEKDTFESYSLNLKEDFVSQLSMTREFAIQSVVDSIGKKDVIVSTTGMISRELFEYRTKMNENHQSDFLTVGSMGHASQIALGVALETPERNVYCFDGDGAIIMHMGSMAIIGDKSPANFIHIVFNNGAHDSVGGQPTVGLKIDIPTIAKSVGYRAVFSVDCKDRLDTALERIRKETGPVLLEIKVRKGNRKDLGRPSITPIQNKLAFMTFLNDGKE